MFNLEFGPPPLPLFPRPAFSRFLDEADLNRDGLVTFQELLGTSWWSKCWEENLSKTNERPAPAMVKF